MSTNSGNGWRWILGLIFTACLAACGGLWIYTRAVDARADEACDRSAVARAAVEALHRETTARIETVQRETAARFEAIQREIKHLREDRSRAADIARRERAQIRAALDRLGGR